MIYELAEGIWSCEQDDGPRIVRQVVIAGDEAVLVVDTGLPGVGRDELLPLVERLGRARARSCSSRTPTATISEARPSCWLRGPARACSPGLSTCRSSAIPSASIRERYARFAVHDDVPFGEAAAERAIDRAGPPFDGHRGRARGRPPGARGPHGRGRPDARTQPRPRRRVDPRRRAARRRRRDHGQRHPDARRRR